MPLELAGRGLGLRRNVYRPMRMHFLGTCQRARSTAIAVPLVLIEGEAASVGRGGRVVSASASESVVDRFEYRRRHLVDA